MQQQHIHVSIKAESGFEKKDLIIKGATYITDYIEELCIEHNIAKPAEITNALRQLRKIKPDLITSEVKRIPNEKDVVYINLYRPQAAEAKKELSYHLTKLTKFATQITVENKLEMPALIKQSIRTLNNLQMHINRAVIGK